MYKVMHWYESLVGDMGTAKIEHYFTDSKAAIEYFFQQTKVHKNVALVVSVKHADFVFLSHYSDDFPEEFRPDNLVEIFTDYDMYDLYEKACGFTRRMFKFNIDGSTKEINTI